MGRTIENKQKIVTEIKSLLDDSEMAVVLDYKGLTIKETVSYTHLRAHET